MMKEIKHDSWVIKGQVHIQEHIYISKKMHTHSCVIFYAIQMKANTTTHRVDFWLEHSESEV